jgi:uncharacterized repeat protein (TIGR01451 family)
LGTGKASAVPAGDATMGVVGRQNGAGRWVAWQRGWSRGLQAAAAAVAALLPALALAADPQVAALVDSPDPVAAGGTYTYTLRIDNNATTAATNTLLNLAVTSGGAAFVSASPASANCTATGALTVRCNLGTLGALGEDVRTVVLTWRATVPGDAVINATATVSADNFDNSDNPANNIQEANTTVVQGANLALTKTGGPNPVAGGSTISYTLTASNAGPNDGGAMVLTDNLPPSVEFLSASGSGWVCSHASGVVTCTRAGVHPVGQAIPPVTITGRVNAEGGFIVNSATVEPALGGVADPEPDNNTATVRSDVTPGADVAIAQKSVTSALPATAGTNVTFQIQPRNAGPATATNAVVTDTLPAGWTYVSATGPGWACANTGNTVRCTRASLPKDNTDNITVVATAPASVAAAGSSFNNTAGITSDTLDGNTGNNSGQVDVLVRPFGADLRIAKTKTPNPVALNATMRSAINVTNGGPRLATGKLRVVDQLSGEVFVSATGDGWDCSASASTVVCDYENTNGLAVGLSLPELTITTRATVAGASQNQACTGSSVPAGAGATQASPPKDGDPNSANDCASVTATSTTIRPDLAITKTTSTPGGVAKTLETNEEAVTYTLVVRNASTGSDSATGVRITDPVPGFIPGSTTFGPFVPVVSAGTATFGCSAAADGTVTCNQTGGALEPNQTVTVPIIVKRPLAEGSFTNIARVGNTAEGDPNDGNDEARDTVTIAPIADVEMTGKQVTPPEVRAGEAATYVLSFRNNGPSTAQNVEVTDSFNFAPGDTGFTVVSFALNGASCTVSAGPAAPGGVALVQGGQITPATPFIRCTVGSLGNGVTQAITLVLRPNLWPGPVQDGTTLRNIPNTARVTTTSVEHWNGTDNGNNSKTATLSVIPARLNLLVNKTDLADPVPFYSDGDGPFGGTFLHYQVLVRNAGPSYGTGVKITETMTPPPGRKVRFVCDTSSAGGSACNSPPLCSVANVESLAGQALPAFTCDVPAGDFTTGVARGDLAAGQGKLVYLRFKVTGQPEATGDVFSNTVTVRANEPDSSTGNDTQTEPTTTRQRIDLHVTKDRSQSAVGLNEPLTWTVRVENRGPGSSLRTDLTDTLPAGVEIIGAVNWARTLPSGGGSCTVSGLVISCALGRLDRDGVATVTVHARFTSALGGGSRINTATVDNDPAKTGGLDIPGRSNTATSEVTLNLASLRGTLFEDRLRTGANGGTQQTGGSEPGIGGVTLTLTGTDEFGNPVTATTTSLSDGSYSFTGLPPSSPAGYTVTQTQPSGYINSPVAPPAAGAQAPSAGGTHSRGGDDGNSSYSGIVLLETTAATQYNFPEVRRPALGGFVYIDADLSGKREAGGADQPISGATVRLINGATGEVRTTSTDSNGAYAFRDLDPLATYTLEQPLPTDPAGLVQGPVNPGLFNNLACASGCTAQPDSPAAGTDRITAIDLSAGVDGTDFNFGERKRTSISGLVYIDADRNNALGPADAGRIAGVELRLVQGSSCSGTELQRVTTGADGSWRFDNVLAGGAYLVCQTQPAAYGQGNANGTAGSNSITIAALPLTGSANNLFGETLASLAGTVYRDNGTGVAAHADNGVKDVGEVGIANVPITVTGTDLAGQAVSVTVTTNSEGNWIVDGLLAAGPAGYTVTEGAIPPESGRFADGRETAGTAGGNATAVNDRISAIALAAGQQATGYLFGELGIAPISGTVYSDLNRNGALDPKPTDGRIPGVTLTLVRGSDCSGAVVATTTTDTEGNYSFSGAGAGVAYTICQTQPAGYLQGGQNPGAGNTSTAANAITITSLPVAGSAGNHFGEIASNSVIAGRVWLDADNGGTVNGSESGIAGVAVDLTGTDIAGNAVTRSTLTDTSGNYRFEGLPPGTYAVREPTQPDGTLDGRSVAGSTGGSATAAGSAASGTPSAITGIVLGLSQTSSENNFGEIPPALVAGRVYADNNDNGSIDAAETGLSGVAITLGGTDDTGAAVSRTTTTRADGSYAFDNLRPGSYTVTEPQQPAGTVNGRTTPGTLGGTATAATVVPSAISAITLPAGGQSTGNNFGEIGQSPDLRVAKTHAPATVTVNNRFTATLAVRNAGELPTVGSYTVSDRLLAGMVLAATPSGNGWACTGAAGDTSFSCSSSTVLAAGASASPITAVVRVAADALARSPLQNLVLVEGGGELAARAPGDAERAAFNAGQADALPVCDAAILHNVCRDPAVVQASASVSGTAWLDSGSSARVLDAGDRRQANWTVEVVDASGTVVGSTRTAADGSWLIADLTPGVPLQVRYRHPESGVVFGYPVNGDTGPGSSGASCDAGAAANGTASSCAHTSGQPVLDIVLAPGRLLPQQSLPLGVDPSGVLYDAGTRTPVAGGTVTLAPAPGAVCTGWDPRNQIAGADLGGYTISGNGISMTVGADGLYQFLFLQNAPGRCTFTVSVAPPSGYTVPSALIPPQAGSLVLPPGPTSHPVQPQAAPPQVGEATTYHTTLETGSAGPAIINNHIPLDPALPGGISLQKTGDRAVAEVGDTVRYSITVQLASGARPRQTTVVDRLPAGFTYIAGTATVDGVRIADPVGGVGPVLAFNLGAMPATNRQLLQYRVRLGVGSQQGDGINRARAHACGLPAGCVGPDGRTPIASSVATNEGQHRVQVSGGVFATEACVLGKVFVDCNGNHVQDGEELGVPGVRLLLSDGTNLVSDSEGKYSVCGLPPRSHVLRIDPHTLPRGSRLTSSSNRNLGEAGSLWLDLKNGELHRADFIEGSCSNTVLDQVKARRAQGEVRAPETERAGQPALRFDSKAHGLDALNTPQQGTDGANQPAPKPRPTDGPPAKGAADRAEQNLPTPALPMNRPPPTGRSTSLAPDAANGGRDASR